MRKRGRPSSASLTVTPSPLEVMDRIKPPHDLTDEQVEIWVAVVAAEPADWFSASTAPLLAQYCRHVVQARHIAELIERATGDRNLEISDYQRLLKMQALETQELLGVATKMRICQQSTTNHRGNKRPTAVRKPWEA